MDVEAMLARAQAAHKRVIYRRSDVPALAADVVSLVERVRALELAADQAGCAMVYAANRVHVEATRRPGKAVLERIGDELIDKRLELEERIGWQCGQQSAAWYIQRESATPRAADPDAA